jgi:hypothetical protein
MQQIIIYLNIQLYRILFFSKKSERYRVLRGVCFKGSFEFEFFFAFSLVCRFSCHLLVLWFFLLLDDLLELFFGFWSSSCASCGLGFKTQTLCLCVVNVLIKGDIEKPSGQYLGLICDE